MEPSDELNGQLAPVERVNDAVRSLSLLRRVELILVITATVAGLLAAGFAAYSANQVRSCTTPGGKCYRDNTVRARESTRSFLEQLNEQHRLIQESIDQEHDVIRCVLLVPLSKRGPGTVPDCEEMTR